MVGFWMWFLKSFIRNFCLSLQNKQINWKPQNNVCWFSLYWMPVIILIITSSQSFQKTPDPKSWQGMRFKLKEHLFQASGYIAAGGMTSVCVNVSKLVLNQAVINHCKHGAWGTVTWTRQLRAEQGPCPVCSNICCVGNSLMVKNSLACKSVEGKLTLCFDIYMPSRTFLLVADHPKLVLLLSCFSHVLQQSLFLPGGAFFFRKQDLVEMYTYNFSAS